MKVTDLLRDSADDAGTWMSVVRGDADVSATGFQQLQNGLEDLDDSAIRRSLPFGKATQTVEVTKQFVRPVNKMDYHSPSG